MLGNFMGVQNLQNLQNLPNLPNMQHGDVLEKLKMQVREMKVGLMVNIKDDDHWWNVRRNFFWEFSTFSS